MSIGNIRISDKEIDKGKLMKYNVLRKEDAQHEQNQRIAERKEYHGCRTGKRTGNLAEYADKLRKRK